MVFVTSFANHNGINWIYIFDESSKVNNASSLLNRMRSLNRKQKKPQNTERGSGRAGLNIWNTANDCS